MPWINIDEANQVFVPLQGELGYVAPKPPAPAVAPLPNDRVVGFHANDGGMYLQRADGFFYKQSPDYNDTSSGGSMPVNGTLDFSTRYTPAELAGLTNGPQFAYTIDRNAGKNEFSPMLALAVMAPAFAGGLFSGSGVFGAEAASALSAADMAAGLLPEFGTHAAYAAGMAGGAGNIISGGNTMFDALEDSIGNFGDWLQTDGGTMYNPQTGEYLTTDGTYNAGSLGSQAAGGADDYYSLASNFTSAGQASAPNGLNDLFGKITSGLKSLGSGAAAANKFYSQATTRQPNMSAANGLASTNLGLPLIAAAAFLLLKG